MTEQRASLARKQEKKSLRIYKTDFFLISATSDGGVMVVKDINSLHTFTPNKGYDFSKNRVIRVLDEIAMTVSSTFEKIVHG